MCVFNFTQRNYYISGEANNFNFKTSKRHKITVLHCNSHIYGQLSYDLGKAYSWMTI